MDHEMGIDFSTNIVAGRVDERHDCFLRDALEVAAANAGGVPINGAGGKRLGAVESARVDADGNLLVRGRILRADLGRMNDCALLAHVKITASHRNDAGHVFHSRIEFLGFDVEGNK